MRKLCARCKKPITKKMFRVRNSLCHVCVLKCMARALEMEFDWLTLYERSQGEQMGAELRQAAEREEKISNV